MLKFSKCVPKRSEAVEKVRPIKFLATIVPVSPAKCNIVAKSCRGLKHCFENFDPRDFSTASSDLRTGLISEPQNPKGAPSW